MACHGEPIVGESKLTPNVDCDTKGLEKLRANSETRNPVLGRNERIVKGIAALFFILLALQTPGLASKKQNQAETGQVSLSIEHIPLTRFVYGEKLDIKAALKGNAEALNFYIRYQGLEEFQVRPMVKSGNGSFLYQLDTSTLPEPKFEYYLEARGADKSAFYPPRAPAESIQVIGESQGPLPEIPEGLPPPQEEEQKFQFPISMNGSLQTKILEKESLPDAEKTAASGNLKFFISSHKQGLLGLDVNSNFSYTNTPPLEEDKVDLTNMMISFSKNNHSLNAGDLSIQETNYSVSGLGRRGIEYSYNNQKVYIHLFDVSSQQVKGFSGFGIPKSSLSIYGGAAGYTFFQDKVTLKAVYLQGNDDPSQGMNIGASELYAGRKGNVISLTEETRLFENKLNLKAEWARSRYDDDIKDTLEAASDNVLQLETNLSTGVFSLGGNYRYIGKDFNSIGLPSLATDRKGYGANFGLAAGIINLSGTYLIQEDNVQENLLNPTTKDHNGNLNLSLAFSPQVSFSFGYQRDSQKTIEGASETTTGDSLSDGFSGTLTLSLQPSANVNFSLTSSNLSGEMNPTVNTSSLTLNFGASFRAGEWLSLNPTLGYSKATKKLTMEDSITYSSLLTGEIAFAPQIFSLQFSGSYNRAELVPESITQSWDFGGGLQLTLDKLIKIGSLSLALRGSYSRSSTTGIPISDYRLTFQGDFSF